MQLRDQAAIIQQHQMAIDQAKRQLAADAAAFANMGGDVGSFMGAPSPPPATGQPPMPGQASVPSGPQQAPQPSVMQASPMPGTLPQAPSGGPSAAPGPASASPAPGAGGDGMAPGNEAFGLIMRVAEDIKRRNPGIDGPTLALAVDRIMGLVAPQLRQQTQILTTQMREQGADTRSQRAAETSRANTADRVGATERGQDISLQRAREQANAAMARVQATQDRIDARFRQGGGNKARLAAQSARSQEIRNEITNATRQLNALTGALVPADDPRYKEAQDRLNRAQQKLDILDKSVQQDDGSVPGPAPAAPTASGPIATDAKGNKVQWNGQTWVPVK